MPLTLTLPTDLDRRLSGLGEAIAAASDEVVFAYLFGSAATSALTPRSDVDVAVFAAPGTDTHVVRLTVARACARHLGTDAVDVVLLNTAPISLAGRVLMSRQVLLGIPMSGTATSRCICECSTIFEFASTAC